MSFGMTGWGFMLGAAGLITLIAALAQLAQVRSFASCSQSVAGSVAGKHVHHSKNHRHYSADVEYAVDGVSYKRSVPIAPSEYGELEMGDSFELKYKPGNPKKIIRADNLTDKSVKSVRIVAIAATALSAIGGALILAGRG